jgi:hypothetical protein
LIYQKQKAMTNQNAIEAKVLESLKTGGVASTTLYNPNFDEDWENGIWIPNFTGGNDLVETLFMSYGLGVFTQSGKFFFSTCTAQGPLHAVEVSQSTAQWIIEENDSSARYLWDCEFEDFDECLSKLGKLL